MSNLVAMIANKPLLEEACDCKDKPTVRKKEDVKANLSEKSKCEGAEQESAEVQEGAKTRAAADALMRKRAGQSMEAAMKGDFKNFDKHADAAEFAHKIKVKNEEEVDESRELRLKAVKAIRNSSNEHTREVAKRIKDDSTDRDYRALDKTNPDWHRDEAEYDKENDPATKKSIARHKAKNEEAVDESAVLQAKALSYERYGKGGTLEKNVAKKIANRQLDKQYNAIEKKTWGCNDKAAVKKAIARHKAKNEEIDEGKNGSEIMRRAENKRSNEMDNFFDKSKSSDDRKKSLQKAKLAGHIYNNMEDLAVKHNIQDNPREHEFHKHLTKTYDPATKKSIARHSKKLQEEFGLTEEEADTLLDLFESYELYSKACNKADKELKHGDFNKYKLASKISSGTVNRDCRIDWKNAKPEVRKAHLDSYKRRDSATKKSISRHNKKLQEEFGLTEEEADTLLSALKDCFKEEGTDSDKYKDLSSKHPEFQTYFDEMASDEAKHAQYCQEMIAEVDKTEEVDESRELAVKAAKYRDSHSGKNSETAHGIYKRYMNSQRDGHPSLIATGKSIARHNGTQENTCDAASLGTSERYYNKGADAYIKHRLAQAKKYEEADEEAGDSWKSVAPSDNARKRDLIRQMRKEGKLTDAQAEKAKKEQIK